MIFQKTPLAGAFIIDIEKQEDERGFFARVFCQNEFKNHDLESAVAQCSISSNPVKGTLRGMHFQAEPYQETKIVRCVQGSIHDVIVDIRPESPTYAQHFAVVLTSNAHNALYIPKGFAHGFLTLEPHTCVFYQMGQAYVPGYERGFRWNDPYFGVAWHDKVVVISERDATFPDYSVSYPTK